MDKAMTSDNAYQFVKTLVEFGDIYYVDQDLIVRSTATDEPAGVNVGTPPVRRPIAVFKTGMKVGDYVALNPFTDVMGDSKERAWFTLHMSLLPGFLLKTVIGKMIQLGLSKNKGAGYKANKFISKWIDKMDDKLAEEVERIPGKMFAFIFYDRSKKTAQVQSNIGYDEFREDYKNKVRKGSWPILNDMVRTLLNTGSKKPESLTYESVILSMPKIDAIMHLLIDVIERMDTPIKEFTEFKYDLGELKEHLRHIEAYREALRWFASATVSDDSQSGIGDAVIPWNNKTADGQFVPSIPQKKDMEESSIANAQPAGIIVNPSFAGGIAPMSGMMGGPLFTSGIIPNPTYNAAAMSGDIGSIVGGSVMSPLAQAGIRTC